MEKIPDISGYAAVFRAVLLNNQDVNKMQPIFPFGETSERVRRELALLRVRIARR